jgi:O-antigen ligase/polysaccharide polymerase Wzy-like membrane protein
MSMVSVRGFVQERKLMLSFMALVAAAMFTPAAKVLVFVFPAGAFFVAFSAFRRDSGLFAEFATWLFFLTPFIRRVVDYETGTREMVIISTPFLVLLIALLAVLSRWKWILGKESAPFCYAAAAVLYGVFIACAHGEFQGAATGLMTWITPIAFGLYVYSEQKYAHEIYGGIERALLGGTFVAGAYGLFQYFAIPSWDAAWMQSVDMVTIGKPEPMSVRVFSIMNSPQVLAAFLMVGILIAYRFRSAWKYPILLVGISSLVLSSARSAWIGLIAGLIFLSFRASSKERVRSLTLTAGCALLLFVTLSVPELSDTLSTRFSTFTDLKHDESALDRQQTYAQVIEMLERSPAGMGVGVDNGMSDAENDSSVVAVLLSLGLPGSLIFAVAMGVCSFTLVSARATRDFPQLLGLQSCFVGLLVESPLNNVVNGQIAFLLWSLVGLSYGVLVRRRNEISNKLKAAIVI